MTQTDIPPGGEGQIEVTFDSSHKKGKQQKSITVESNDPDKPSASLRISVFIEVEFEFAPSSLSVGHIRRGEATTKTAVLMIKDPSKKNLINLTTQSSQVGARLIESAAVDSGRIDVEITVSPEAPAGKLNQWVMAELPDGSYPTARLQIEGTIIGNVEVSPENLRFTADTSQSATAQAVQEIQVSGTQTETKFQLLGVEDSKDLLAIAIDTVAAGERYVIRAKPNAKALKLRGSASGVMKILTDDSEQPVFAVSYGIVIKR